MRRSPLSYLWRRLLIIALAMIMLITGLSGLASAAVPPHVVERAGLDARLSWHYPERYAPAITELEQQAPAQIERLWRELALDELDQTPAIQVWLLGELDHYFQWHELAGRAPEWAIGLSLTNRQTVLVRHGVGLGGQPVDLQKTLAHELAHVAMDYSRQGHHVPRWLNEGYASHFAKEWTLERGELVARMAASGRLIPMSELDRYFPAHHETTSLAYAQSHHFIRHLERQYGASLWPELMRHIRSGETLSVAFTLTTGDDFERVEFDWRTGLAAQSSPWSVFADGTLLFFGLSVLFLLTWRVRRRRTRQLFDRLDDDLGDWGYDPEAYPLPGMSRGLPAA